MRFPFSILALLVVLSSCVVNPVPTPAASGAKLIPDAGAVDSGTDAVTSGDTSLGGDGTASKFACTGKEPPGAWSGKFGCGYCGSDAFYPIECVNGLLACVKSYPASGSGPTIEVPPDAQVLDMAEWGQHTGPCAFMAPYYVPGFRLWSPASLETNRDPKLPLKLEAAIGAAMVQPTFNALLADPVAGDAAVHALVTLTDMQTGKAVPYTLGTVQIDQHEIPTLDLLAPALTAGGWYRVTIQPGETQSFVQLVTFDAYGALKAPQLTDFYTSSRPMMSRAAVVYKANATMAGYVEFEFTEDLVAADLPSQVTVLADGVPVSGCTAYLQPCQGLATNLTSLKSVELMLATMPVGFKTLELRLPAAAHSVNGGTLGDGTKDNPHAGVVGADVVYVLKASDMTLEDQGVTLRWRFAAK